MTLKDFLCLSFSSFLPSVTHALPWPIKGKAGHPLMGIDSWHRTSHRITAEPLASNLEHIAEQWPSSRHPFDLSTRDLGPIPLSPVCNPYSSLLPLNKCTFSLISFVIELPDFFSDIWPQQRWGVRSHSEADMSVSIWQTFSVPAPLFTLGPRS